MTFVKITEQPSLYDNLEDQPIRTLLEEINQEDRKVPEAVGKAIPQIEKLVTAIVERMKQGGRIFYTAQPVGQAATETLTPTNAQKLRGEVGDAIQASGLVDQRVYYELDLETGHSNFVGKERMRELLAGKPELLMEFEKETSEAAEVTGKYLRKLK